MIDDDVFEALANRHRRRLLLGLLTEGVQYVPELSGSTRELAHADDGLLRQRLSDGRESTGADGDLLRVRCVHLPALADYGFVDWDRRAHAVTKGPRFDDVEPLLEWLDAQRAKHSPKPAP